MSELVSQSDKYVNSRKYILQCAFITQHTHTFTRAFTSTNTSMYNVYIDYARIHFA